METNLENLKAEAETSEEVPTIDTSEMEADIREAEEALEDIKKRETAILEEIEALHPGIEEHKRRLDEVAARNEKIMEDLDKAETKVEDIVKVRFVNETQRRFASLVCDYVVDVMYREEIVARRM